MAALWSQGILWVPDRSTAWDWCHWASEVAAHPPWIPPKFLQLLLQNTRNSFSEQQHKMTLLRAISFLFYWKEELKYQGATLSLLSASLVKAAASSVRTGRGLLVAFSGSSIWASRHCPPSAVWGPQRTCALPSPAEFLKNESQVQLGSQYDRWYFIVSVDNDFRLATNMSVDAYCFSRSGGQSREDTNVPRLGASLFWSCWKSLTLAEFCLHLKKSVQRKKKKNFCCFPFYLCLQGICFC